jgi:MFS family permease
MAAQVPGGAFVDAVRSKRAAVAAAIAAIAASALLIAAWPAFLPIAVAEVLHAFASAVLGPGIAALSLVVVDRRAFAYRLGRNARYAAVGNAVAAGLMGACGYYLSERGVFLLTAALGLPALVALEAIRGGEAAPPPRRAAAEPAQGGSWSFLKQRGFVAFFACAGLFQLGNAAILPIAAGAVTKRAGSEASLVIAACIVGPQVITALLSPWVGRAAELWGRRPMLLLGFGALPIRGVLFAALPDPYLAIPIQLLDGVGAAVFGVLMPLIVADITRDTGHYTTTLGIVGLAIGGGATLSTTAAGLLADHAGGGAAFLGLASVGLCATLLVWLAMPETRPAPDPNDPQNRTRTPP